MSSTNNEKYRASLDEAWAQFKADRSPDAPTVISTFAGAGGSSMGYHMAGFRELLAVEWDDHAVACLRKNFHGLDVYHGDIAKLSVEEVLRRTGLQPGDLDVFDGSPPCQGFSTAGKREFHDDRNQLFREYVRLLRGLQPRVFVMENVSGMVKGGMKVIFAEILTELKASGYQVKSWLFNAMHYGVPQSRERMIFIGVRNDLGILPTPPKATTPRPFTVRDAIGDLPIDTQDDGFSHIWIDEVARDTKWWRRADQLKPGERLIHDVASSYRLRWDAPCGTILKSFTSAPYVRNSNIHPSKPRTLSIREIMRCASFPDGYVMPDALAHGYDRVGNSVPPLFMREIARHVRATIIDPARQSATLESPGEPFPEDQPA